MKNKKFSITPEEFKKEAILRQEEAIHSLNNPKIRDFIDSLFSKGMTDRVIKKAKRNLKF